MKNFATTLLLLLPVNALANEASTASQQSGLVSFLPLIVVFVIFYFLMIRPQQKKIKEHNKMVSELKIGNNVCTTSGIIGKIRGINDKDDTISVEIADGVVVNMLRNSVNNLVTKNDEAKAEGNKKSKKIKSK